MSQCSYRDCIEHANVKVHYEELNGAKELPRSLCKSHYDSEDPPGFKYYQVGSTNVEVL